MSGQVKYRRSAAVGNPDRYVIQQTWKKLNGNMRYLCGVWGTATRGHGGRFFFETQSALVLHILLSPFTYDFPLILAPQRQF